MTTYENFSNLARGVYSLLEVWNGFLFALHTTYIQYWHKTVPCWLSGTLGTQELITLEDPKYRDLRSQPPGRIQIFDFNMDSFSGYGYFWRIWILWWIWIPQVIQILWWIQIPRQIQVLFSSVTKENCVWVRFPSSFWRVKHLHFTVEELST